jgi:hypothetical protein
MLSRDMNNDLHHHMKIEIHTNNNNIFSYVPAMTALTASICWNVLAHKSDDVGEIGVRIYQKPEGNDIYELRRKKIPPICKENENPDAVWCASETLHEDLFLISLRLFIY